MQICSYLGEGLVIFTNLVIVTILRSFQGIVWQAVQVS